MDKLYLGIKGRVVCLNKQTGVELWRTKLKTDWGKPTMVVHSENLYAYVAGELYCLDSDTGEIKWTNTLKGLGSGPCVIAVAGRSVDGEVNTQGESIMSQLIDTAIDVST